jgi:hypothetical protein
MMTKKEFNELEVNARTALVWSTGQFIDERIIYGKYHIKMYAMKNFFVEVWIDLKRLNIEKVQAIESETDWSGYLHSISIADLM